MNDSRETPEKLTDARVWLAQMPTVRDLEQQLTMMLEALSLLHTMREMTEELTNVVELADLYEVQPGEIEAARQHLALHHRIVDSALYELTGYLPGTTDVPEWLLPLRAVLYGVLDTAHLGYAIHAHDAFRRVRTQVPDVSASDT